MTDRERVFGAICEILRDEVRCTAPITPATDLLADAQLDSIDLLTLTVELENRFAIAFDDDEDDEDPDRLQVGRLVDRVLHHLGDAPPASPDPDGACRHE